MKDFSQDVFVSGFKTLAEQLLVSTHAARKQLLADLHLASRKRVALDLAKPLRVSTDIRECNESARGLLDALANGAPDWEQWEQIERGLRPGTGTKKITAGPVTCYWADDHSASPHNAVSPRCRTAEAVRNVTEFITKFIDTNPSLSEDQLVCLRMQVYDDIGGPCDSKDYISSVTQHGSKHCLELHDPNGSSFLYYDAATVAAVLENHRKRCAEQRPAYERSSRS